MDLIDSYKYLKPLSGPMEPKQVTLSPDVYELLLTNQREDENLSDTIRRLILGKKKKLSDFAGLWKDIPDEEIKRMKDLIVDMRKSSTRRLHRILKEF